MLSTPMSKRERLAWAAVVAALSMALTGMMAACVVLASRLWSDQVAQLAVVARLVLRALVAVVQVQLPALLTLFLVLLLAVGLVIERQNGRERSLEVRRG